MQLLESKTTEKQPFFSWLLQNIIAISGTISPEQTVVFLEKNLTPLAVISLRLVNMMAISQMTLSPRQQLALGWNGAFAARCLNIVVELGIADLIGDSPVFYFDLAHQAKVNPDALYRSMRLLSGYGVFKEINRGLFAHTPASLLLRKNAPGSLRNYARIWGGPWQWQILERLAYCLQTGEAAIQEISGSPALDEYIALALLAGNENELQYLALMDLLSGAREAFLNSFPWPAIRTACELGNAELSLLPSFSIDHPGLQVVIVDLPQQVSGACNNRQAQFGEHLNRVVAHLQDSIPVGFDLYLINQVIARFSTDVMDQVLIKIKTQAGPNSRLGILDFLVADTTIEPDFIRAVDLHLLMTDGARAYSRSEYAQLLEKRGFCLKQITETPTPIRLIVASPTPNR